MPMNKRPVYALCYNVSLLYTHLSEFPLWASLMCMYTCVCVYFVCENWRCSTELSNGFPFLLCVHMCMLYVVHTYVCVCVCVRVCVCVCVCVYLCVFLCVCLGQAAGG